MMTKRETILTSACIVSRFKKKKKKIKTGVTRVIAVVIDADTDEHESSASVLHFYLTAASGSTNCTTTRAIGQATRHHNEVRTSRSLVLPLCPRLQSDERHVEIYILRARGLGYFDGMIYPPRKNTEAVNRKNVHLFGLESTASLGRTHRARIKIRFTIENNCNVVSY